MSKKVKILVSVLVAVVLLVAGGAAAVMAQGKESVPTPEPATKALMTTANTTGILARVAEILGINEETLTNAFKQAQQEMREEALIKRLDKAVEEGRLTREEADAIRAWWEQRPEVIDSGPFPGGFGLPALRGGDMMGGPGGWGSDNTTSLLPRAFGKHMMGGPRGWGWIR